MSRARSGLFLALLAASVVATGCVPVLIGSPRDPFDSTIVVVPPVVGAPGPEAAVWLTPGERIRVTAPSAGIIHQTATLMRMSGDSIVLRGLGARRGDTLAVPDSGRLALPLGRVTSFEISLGVESHRRGGVLLGALIGAVAGYVLGGSGGCDVDVGSHVQHLPCAVLGTGGGALIGAAAGAVVGGALHSERWEQVPLNQLRRARVTSLPGGRALTGASPSVADSLLYYPD